MCKCIKCLQYTDRDIVYFDVHKLCFYYIEKTSRNVHLYT